MKAKEFYEAQRIKGRTTSITANPNPNYEANFYISQLEAKMPSDKKLFNYFKSLNEVPDHLFEFEVNIRERVKGAKYIIDLLKESLQLKDNKPCEEGVCPKCGDGLTYYDVEGYCHKCKKPR